MKVANPIYNVVFKYLLDDKKIAKLIISKILNEDIVSLEFRPTELKKKDNYSRFTVFRIDFTATIQQPDGNQKIVIIEIQKAKFHTDIMRFRKYQDKNAGKTIALPTVSLFFLEHKLDHTDAPVVKVDRQYIDLADKSELAIKEEFIESLTHDSYIIQISQLKRRRRNILEILLSIFDQSLKLSGSDHFLDLSENDYPHEFRIVIRRLLEAGAEVGVCETMELEDGILDEFESLERQILDKYKEIEGKDKENEEKNKIINNALAALVRSGMPLEAAKKILLK